MKNFNMILIDKLQKISAVSSGKINKYEDLTGEEIVPSNQKQTIEQTIFTFSPLGQAFEKQTKTIEDQGEKQAETIKEHRKQIHESNEVTKNEIFKKYLKRNI